MVWITNQIPNKTQSEQNLQEGLFFLNLETWYE